MRTSDARETLTSLRQSLQIITQQRAMQHIRLAIRARAGIQIPEQLHVHGRQQGDLLVALPAEQLVALLVGDLLVELGVHRDGDAEVLSDDAGEARVAGEDAQRRGQVAAGGCAADDDALRVDAELGGVGFAPLEGVEGVVDRGGEDVLGGSGGWSAGSLPFSFAKVQPWDTHFL